MNGKRAGSEEEIDLEKPSLHTVRRHKVGIFRDISYPRGQRPIKTLTLPPWLKKGISRRISIEKKIWDLLKNDGTKSNREKGKRTYWVPAYDGEKGYHMSHVRTPKGSKWVLSTIAKERYNKKAGRKEGGDAYKLRREFWRGLNRDNLAKLLADYGAWIEKRKDSDMKRVNVPLVNLSRALEEMLSLSLFNNDGLVSEEFVKKWYRKLRSSFNPDLSDEEIVPYVYENQRHFTQIIAEKHWCAILAHLSEIEIENRIASKNARLKKSKHIHEDEAEIMELELDEDIAHFCPECGVFDWSFDSKRAELSCNECGLVSKDVEMSGEEIFFETIG